MANKTAEEILRSYFVHAHSGRGDLDTAGNPIDDKIAEASRQLYEAELQRIGEDEPNVTFVSGDSLEMVDAMNSMIDFRNTFRAEQRAKARAFYGITETEEEAE